MTGRPRRRVAGCAGKAPDGSPLLALLPAGGGNVTAAPIRAVRSNGKCPPLEPRESVVARRSDRVPRIPNGCRGRRGEPRGDGSGRSVATLPAGPDVATLTLPLPANGAVGAVEYAGQRALPRPAVDAQANAEHRWALRACGRHVRTAPDPCDAERPGGDCRRACAVVSGPVSGSPGGRVCEIPGFRDAPGRLQEAGRVKALRGLATAGPVSFPEPRNGGGGGAPRRPGIAVPDPVGVPDRAGAVEGLSLREVRSDADRRTWNELSALQHPRGAARLAGAQPRSGRGRWERSTVWGMLRNPAYKQPPRGALAVWGTADFDLQPYPGTGNKLVSLVVCGRRSMGIAMNDASRTGCPNFQAAMRVAIRRRFRARQTSNHSPCTCFWPRRRKRRKPRASLIHPFDASDNHFLSA